jgi:hypothetical protein
VDPEASRVAVDLLVFSHLYIQDQHPLLSLTCLPYEVERVIPHTIIFLLIEEEVELMIVCQYKMLGSLDYSHLDMIAIGAKL